MSGGMYIHSILFALRFVRVRKQVYIYIWLTFFPKGGMLMVIIGR